MKRWHERKTDWWVSAWDEYGHSLDTGRIVQITAGVLAPASDPKVAVSVAGETPITLTHDAVERFQECLSWAVEEQRTLSARAPETRENDIGTGTVTLNHEQWKSVVSALNASPRQHPEAVKALLASAPPAWLNDIEEP